MPDASREPRAIVFDAVGTLIYPAPPVAEAYAELGRRHGSRLEPEDVQPRFRQAFAQQEQLDAGALRHATSERRERARWRQIVEQVFTDVADHEPLFADLWEHFRDARHWRLFDDVRPAWDELHGRGVRLAIGSNFDSRLLEICRCLAPLDRAESVFVSSLMGVRKPSRRFFDIASRQLQLAGPEILLIGDDWVNDYEAARAAGWQAMWLARSGDPGPGAIPDLRSLAALYRSEACPAPAQRLFTGNNGA